MAGRQWIREALKDFVFSFSQGAAAAAKTPGARGGAASLAASLQAPQLRQDMIRQTQTDEADRQLKIQQIRQQLLAGQQDQAFKMIAALRGQQQPTQTMGADLGPMQGGVSKTFEAPIAPVNVPGMGNVGIPNRSDVAQGALDKFRQEQQITTDENIRQTMATQQPKADPVSAKMQEYRDYLTTLSAGAAPIPFQEWAQPPRPDTNVQTVTTEEGIFVLKPDGTLGNRIGSRPKPQSSDREPIVAIIGPDGNPTYVPQSQAINKRPASTREQGRSVTSGDAGRISDIDDSLNDLKTLRTTIPAGATGTSAKLGAMLPNAITDLTGWGVTAKQKQAVIDRVKQVIGKALEGGVLRKEDEYKYEKILPTIADTSAVVKTKLDGLDRAIQDKRETFLSNLEDANFDVSKYRSRSSSNTATVPAGVDPAVWNVMTPQEKALWRN